MSSPSSIEFLDEITPTGELTGRKEARNVIHQLGLWHQVVHVWIVNSERKLLVQLRAKQKESWPGLLDVSAAGHVSSGDGPHESANRELEEELGLKIPIDDFARNFLFKVPIQAVLRDGKYLNNELAVVYLLEMEIDLHRLVLQESEVERVEWIDYLEYDRRIRAQDPLFVPTPYIELLTRAIDQHFADSRIKF